MRYVEISETSQPMGILRGEHIIPGLAGGEMREVSLLRSYEA